MQQNKRDTMTSEPIYGEQMIQEFIHANTILFLPSLQYLTRMEAGDH